MTRPAPHLLSLLATVGLLLAGCGGESSSGGGGPGDAGAGDGRPTRLVLITLDTLRADRFDAERMPRLHAAAAEGLVFDSFHASTSVTLPTHASLLTGLHPWQHGALRNGVLLDEGLDTLAERLGAAGYATAAVVASYPLERRFRADQGFDVYEDAFTLSSDKATWNEHEVPGGYFSSPADSVVDRALAQLDAADGERQFFFWHFFDPHAPYGDGRPKPMELEVLLKAARNGDADLSKQLARAQRLYDADVRFLDEQLGRLLDRLAADADRWATHVLVTADHGESFGDDGSLGHGKRVSPPQIHVPTMLLSPAVSAGRRADVAGSVDVAPTFLALAGLPTDGLPGRDLLAPVPAAPLAVGMRSLFGTAQRDIRTDGRALRVDAPRFYLVQGAAHFAGDGRTAERLGPADGVPDDGAAGAGAAGASSDAPDPDDVARLFRGFALEAGDAKTRAALDALGYLR